MASNYYCALETLSRLLETVPDGGAEALPLNQVIDTLITEDGFEQASVSEIHKSALKKDRPSQKRLRPQVEAASEDVRFRETILLKFGCTEN